MRNCGTRPRRLDLGDRSGKYSSTAHFRHVVLFHTDCIRVYISRRQGRTGHGSDCFLRESRWIHPDKPFSQQRVWLYFYFTYLFMLHTRSASLSLSSHHPLCLPLSLSLTCSLFPPSLCLFFWRCSRPQSPEASHVLRETATLHRADIKIV